MEVLVSQEPEIFPGREPILGAAEVRKAVLLLLNDSAWACFIPVLLCLSVSLPLSFHFS